MTTTIIDGVTLADNGEASGEYTNDDPEYGEDHLVYIEGDGQSTDVTVEFYVEPRGMAGTDTFYHVADKDQTNVDLSGDSNQRRAFHDGGMKGAGRIRVRVVDNRGSGSDTVISVHVDPYAG